MEDRQLDRLRAPRGPRLVVPARAARRLDADRPAPLRGRVREQRPLQPAAAGVADGRRGRGRRPADVPRVLPLAARVAHERRGRRDRAAVHAHGHPCDASGADGHCEREREWGVECERERELGQWVEQPVGHGADVRPDRDVWVSGPVDGPVG